MFWLIYFYIICRLFICFKFCIICCYFFVIFLIYKNILVVKNRLWKYKNIGENFN